DETDAQRTQAQTKSEPPARTQGPLHRQHLPADSEEDLPEAMPAGVDCVADSAQSGNRDSRALRARGCGRLPGRQCRGRTNLRGDEPASGPEDRPRSRLAKRKIRGHATRSYNVGSIGSAG